MQALMEMVIEDGEDLICILNVDKSIIYVNKAFCNYIKVEGEDIKGRSIDTFLPEAKMKLSLLSNNSTEVTYNVRRVVNGEFSRYKWTIKLLFHKKNGNFYLIKGQRINCFGKFPAVNKSYRLSYKLNKEIKRREQVENRLQHVDVFIQELIDAIPTPVIYQDLKGIYIGCNKSYEKFTGLKKENIIGKTGFDIFPEEDAFKINSYDKEILQKRRSKIYEIKSRYMNGKSRDMIVSKAPFHNKDGTTAGIIVIITDITKIKKSQEKLKLTIKRTNEILDSLPFAITTYGADNKLTYINRYALELTGFSLNEVLGLSSEEFASMYTRDKTDILLEVFENTPITNKLRTLKARNGDIKISVDIYKLNYGGYLCIFDDANKIQALENLQIQTKSILDAVNQLILIYDTDRKILMCNKNLENTMGIYAEDFVGMPLEEMDRIFKISKKSFAEDDTIQEISLINLRGEKKFMLLSTSPIFNVNKEVIGYIEVATDYTGIKKEEEELKQIEKLALLGQMASGIVHEIRNPLTAIMGFSHIIRMKSEGEDIKVLCEEIEKETCGLNKIVSDFLKFAKPERPTLTPVSPNALVESIKLLIDTHAFSKGIKIEYDLGQEEKMIEADENQIKQVALNIIKNAVEALSKSSSPLIRIKTGCEYDPKVCYIEIHNNGPILSKEEKEKIGTPFFSTKTKGTGLGMSISNQIMREHNGLIEISSEPGSGTTFKLVFPYL